MGLLLLPRLAMLLVVVPVCLFSFSLPYIVAQSDTKTSARVLDALLQDHAYRAFVRPRTGIVYNGVVPSNLIGMKIAAMRLRSGSLRTRGVKMYKEFGIPIGVTESPYVERLVLVYQNLGNWSKTYYPLPGYTYLSPVLGLLAYDASNLTTTNLPELEIRASGDPLSITFQDMMSAPAGSVAKCVWFDLHGLTKFSNATSGNTCSTTEQGHFSIVVESVAPSPSPVSPVPGVPPSPRRENKKSNSKVWIIVGPVLVDLALLVLLAFLVLLWLHKYKHRKKMQKAADVGEALQMT
ncbi:hypothetical protein EZV62_009354 [Acer yangbiense]|uniref:Uncharacterized protein n=1 Tax=Acer yangbiense TaxID=1000413 RepID=A0A5C7IGE1_9ROSI|nr:hypothetical protein EZV62_009354 [Acer yangbiense]